MPMENRNEAVRFVGQALGITKGLEARLGSDKDASREYSPQELEEVWRALEVVNEKLESAAVQLSDVTG